MTADKRIVSTAEQVQWRAWWGVPAKVVNRCPLCGVEVTRGQRCKYHANARTNRRYRVIRMLCEAIDEARHAEV